MERVLGFEGPRQTDASIDFFWKANCFSLEALLLKPQMLNLSFEKPELHNSKRARHCCCLPLFEKEKMFCRGFSFFAEVVREVLGNRNLRNILFL